jgi:WD40 repeat protein
MIGLVFGVILLVRTPDGTIRIELIGDAEGAEVTVDGHEVAITKLADPLHLKVRSDHQLEITGKNFKAISKSFDVRKGENPALRITLEPNQPVVAKPEPVPVQVPSKSADPNDVTLVPRELPRGPAPLDSLRRDMIPRELLAAAGHGDPDKAPKEIVAILGSSRLRHWQSIHHVIFSPNGRFLASSGRDQIVRLWDTSTWNEVRDFMGHTATVHGLSFSKDGTRLASAGEDNTVRIWDVATGRELEALRKEGSGAILVAFRGDDKALVGGCSDGSVKVWETANATVRFVLKGHKSAIRTMSFLGDGPVLATAGYDGEVRFWNTETGTEMGSVKAHTREPNLSISRDGKTMATGSWDVSVKIWKLTEMDGEGPNKGKRQIQAQLLHDLKARNDVHGIGLSPDGKWLVTGCISHLLVWDVTLGKEVSLIADPVPNIAHDVAFAPDGKYFVTGNSLGDIRIWDPKTWTQIRHDDLPFYSTEALSISADGKLIAAGRMDTTITLYDAATGHVRGVIGKHDQGVLSLAFHPEGTMLASAGWDPYIKLWEMPSGKYLHTLTGYGFAVNGVAFDPFGKYLFSSSGDQTARCWETSAGFPPPMKIFKGAKVWLTKCSVHPTEPVAASGDGNGIVHIWNVNDARELHALSGHRAAVNDVAFRPDGRVLASASHDGTVMLWNAATGKELGTPIGHQGSVRSVSYRPDGRVLASAGHDGTVRLWDSTTGRQTVLRLGAISEFIYYAIFSPDGRHLITANANGTIYILRLAPPIP